MVLLLCRVSPSFVERTFSFSSLSISAMTSLNQRLQFNIWTVPGGFWLISFLLKIYSIFLVLYMSGHLGLHLRNWAGYAMRTLFIFSCMLAHSFAWLSLAILFRSVYCWTYLRFSRYDFHLNPWFRKFWNLKYHPTPTSYIYIFSALTFFPFSLLQYSLSFGRDHTEVPEDRSSHSVMEPVFLSPTPSFQWQRNWIINSWRCVPYVQGKPKLISRILS